MIRRPLSSYLLIDTNRSYKHFKKEECFGSVGSFIITGELESVAPACQIDGCQCQLNKTLNRAITTSNCLFLSFFFFTSLMILQHHGVFSY